MEATELDLLVLEIMALAYAVDRLTDYAVFVDYSGHIEQLSVKIVESKDSWQTEIASTKFYINGKCKTNYEGWLNAKRDHLMHIVETHEVDIDAMKAVVTQTVEYAF